MLAALLGGTAHAQPRSEADATGHYLGIGPVAVLTSMEDAFDGGFGGELAYARVHEHRSLAVVAVAGGAIQFTERDGGRLWLDLLAGVNNPLGGWLGLGIGPAVEVDAVRVPRWGGQLTAWVHIGVTPFVRVGHVEKTGTFVDVGLKVVLPAIRW